MTYNLVTSQTLQLLSAERFLKHHLSNQYFVKIQSPGYVLFIDASKAFDRVCHSHLFNILEERGICPLIRRLLFKMCKDQRIRLVGTHVYQISLRSVVM